MRSSSFHLWCHWHPETIVSCLFSTDKHYLFHLFAKKIFFTLSFLKIFWFKFLGRILRQIIIISNTFAILFLTVVIMQESLKDLEFHFIVFRQMKKKTKKQRLHACKIADRFCISNAQIFSVHFAEADYVWFIKSELLNLKSKRLLKHASVPSIKMVNFALVINNSRSQDRIE